MAANGISTKQYKRDRQLAKLEIAQAKRQGKTVIEGGGTYSIQGSVDSSKPYYRENNFLDITLLPTVYAENDNRTSEVVDNPNPDGLQLGRPWQSDADFDNLELEDGNDLLTENNELISLE